MRRFCGLTHISLLQRTPGLSHDATTAIGRTTATELPVRTPRWRVFPGVDCPWVVGVRS